MVGSAESEFLTNVHIARIQVEATIKLRHSVLWPDRSLSEVRLPEDDSGYHFGAFLLATDEPVAVISLFTEELPAEDDDHTVPLYGHDLPADPTARFRKFACDPRYQRRGIGTKLLEHVLMTSRLELGAKVIWCDARVSSSDWYRKRGMIPFGRTFYKGPVEYVRMKKNLVI